MTMGLKLASAGDAKDDQKTQNGERGENGTSLSLFFCFWRARGANYAQNQVARAERENSRREEWVREKRSSGYRTLLRDATLSPASDHALTLRHHPEGRHCGPLWRRKEER